MKKEEKAAEASRLMRQFPLRRPKYISRAFLDEKKEESDWVSSIGKDAPTTAGLCTHEPRRANFRRFEGGMLFSTPGEDRLTARLALGVFEKRLHETNTTSGDYILVPRSRLRELSDIESKLRDERNQLERRCLSLANTSEDNCSLASPSPATAYVLIAGCRTEMERAESNMKALNAAWKAKQEKEGSFKPWRKKPTSPLRKNRKSPISNKRKILHHKTEIIHARLALRTGNWRTFIEGVEAQKSAAERSLMAFEDAHSRLCSRWEWASHQLSDYRLYCELTAQYGIPFSESEFIALGNRAGHTYLAMCEHGARAFQRMYEVYGPIYRLRRKRAATKIQTQSRGYIARSTWIPVYCLRARVQTTRPLRSSFAQWHSCVARTKRARELLRKIRYGTAAKILREWRGTVGGKTGDAAVATILDNTASQLIEIAVHKFASQHVHQAEKIINTHAYSTANAALDFLLDELLDDIIARFVSRIPDWMDSRWFLRNLNYNAHVALARVGVLRSDLFEYERMRIAGQKAATIIQAQVRSIQARFKVRPRVATVFRKKFDTDSQCHYYLNLKTGTVQWSKPYIICRLFPASQF